MLVACVCGGGRGVRMQMLATSPLPRRATPNVSSIHCVGLGRSHALCFIYFLKVVLPHETPSEVRTTRHSPCPNPRRAPPSSSPRPSPSPPPPPPTASPATPSSATASTAASSSRRGACSSSSRRSAPRRGRSSCSASTTACPCATSTPSMWRWRPCSWPRRSRRSPVVCR